MTDVLDGNEAGGRRSDAGQSCAARPRPRSKTRAERAAATAALPSVAAKPDLATATEGQRARRVRGLGRISGAGPAPEAVVSRPSRGPECDPGSVEECVLGVVDDEAVAVAADDARKDEMATR
jgi:hypothetical protein